MMHMQRSTVRKNRQLKKDEVSIVIPVHNEENYLPFSLRPLLDLKGIRIIIVLDRSTDRSEVIVRKFAEKHGNTLIVKKEVAGKTDNPAWEAYMEGVKYAKPGKVLFLGADVVIDKKIFNYLDRAGLLKFRYVNYASHFRYSFEKIVQRFFSRSYCVECMDTEIISAIPFVSESYEDIVRGRTKLIDVINAGAFASEFVYVDDVECLHLRPRVPVDRQFLQGYVRHMQSVPFFRVLLHSLLYRKVHVLRGYVFRMLRKRNTHGR